MTTLTDETTETKTNGTSVDELDALLGSYNKTYSVDETKAATETKPLETVGAPVDAVVNWKGNPNYYQTGEKAGKLKPSAKKKIPAEESEIGGSLVDGALALLIIDIIFPLLIVFLNNKFSKDVIEVDDLQMTDRQKKDLTPIMDEVLKKMNFKAQPEWALIISLCGIYGMNFMAAKSKS
jgi:hypothetical protein